MPAAVDKCVRRIKPALREQYPNKSEAEIERIAWAKCNQMWKEGRLTRDGKEVKLW